MQPFCSAHRNDFLLFFGVDSASQDPVPISIKQSCRLYGARCSVIESLTFDDTDNQTTHLFQPFFMGKNGLWPSLVERVVGTCFWGVYWNRRNHRTMETPDWKKFEQLAAAIQRELAPDAKITENAKLVGKSGSKRQIDILIEEETGQFKLRIAIDCKDYKNPVDIKDVETFLGLLTDVGAHKGAMVAAHGFTAAARERALNAGLDLFRLVDTANHKWRSYVTVPAVYVDYQIGVYSFSISFKGRGVLSGDPRYMPILRSDGSLIDYACNLVLDRWEDNTIPDAPGEHRDIPLTSEATFLPGPSGHFEANIRVNAHVQGLIFFGQLPLQQFRGFKSEHRDVTHWKSMLTAPFVPEKIMRDWQKIESIDQLAVRPEISLYAKSMYPRYKPKTQG